MLVPHLYLKGKCEKAISQYAKALGAEVKVLIRHDDDDPQKGVMHAEIYIHGQRIMLNDVGADNGHKPRNPVELVVIYDSVEELKNAYEIMKEGSQTISPMEETFYSPCVVEFRDRFGIPWGFMVGKP
jgi:PhnB protein